jgi:hypothetical protein
MDAPEDHVDMADALKDQAEHDREPISVEGQDEKPAVEPFDPYFGRSKREKLFWP